MAVRMAARTDARDFLKLLTVKCYLLLYIAIVGPIGNQILEHGRSGQENAKLELNFLIRQH